MNNTTSALTVWQGRLVPFFSKVKPLLKSLLGRLLGRLENRKHSVPTATAGRGQLFVQTPNFKVALQTAMERMSLSGATQLSWKLVYEREQILRAKNRRIAPQLVGYLFYNRAATSSASFFSPVQVDKDLKQPLFFEIKILHSGVFIRCQKNFSKLIKQVAFRNKVASSLKKQLCTASLEKACQLLLASKPNTWVYLESSTPNPSRDARVIITVSKEKTQAFLKLIPPKSGGREAEASDVEQVLREKKITFGIIKKNYLQALSEKRYQTICLIAQGRPALQGNDGYVEAVALKKALKGKKASELRARVNFTAVKKNEVLFRLHPPKAGKEGRSVYGQVIPVSPPQEATLLRGDNMEFAKNKSELISKLEGHLTREETGWAVREVLRLENISFGSEEVVYNGSLVVNGSVADGVVLKVAGNLEIKNSVGHCQLTAGGDIYLQRGVNGRRGETFIKSYFGGISGRFFQAAEIECENNLLVEKQLIDCEVAAGGKVAVLSESGSIWGGLTSAYQEISVAKVGNISGRSTKIEIGIPLRLRLEKKQLLKKIAAHQVLLSKNQKMVSQLNQLSPVEREKKKKALEIQIETLKKELAEAKRVLQEKAILFETHKNLAAKLTVRHTLFGGVEITAGKTQLLNKSYRTRLVCALRKNDKLEERKYFDLLPYEEEKT